MNDAIRKIHEAFDRKGLKHKVDQMGGASIIHTGMSGDNSTYQFIFIKQDDKGNDVTLRAVKLAHFPAHRKAEVCRLLNSFQAEYRYAKFVMEESGDIYIGYDFPTICNDIGEAAVEVLLMLSNIADKCYPKLMKLQWR